MEVTVTESLGGSRLDKAIVALVDGASRARVKRAVEDGEVRLNGRRAPKGAVVNAGDVITLDGSIARSADEACLPEPDAPLAVRHETSALLVVEKPAGQPTAPLRGDEKGSLAGALVGRYPELAGVGYSPLEPGIVHRLDTDTSGLVVVARTAAAFEVLREALQSDKLQKEYLLICASEGLPDDGMIEHPIANHPKDKKRVYPCVHPRDVMRYAPRPALTKFTVVRRAGDWALVRATAPRAVRHQLRAHFSSIEHALAGDRLYGIDESLPRHALHASRVAFEGEGQPELRFDVSSDLPADMQALLP
ncbi:MAG: RluA family pseudouridine synthase [Labilithrix sp.]|nr:RluA family pseudouridine synthase [Labilithrix sp.]MCW5815531.1 RluA family pseudouridine synthase [Labilithrix sp.]